MTDALALQCDAVLLDLDGVVYVGRAAVPGAPDVLARLRKDGVPLCYVTNNASRTPEQVAEQLSAFGIPVVPDDILSSAQAGARLVAEQVPPGAAVLAVGGAGVAAALREAGLAVVDAVHDPMPEAGDDVAAVLQGFGREVGWQALARASFALADGIPWVATNTDLTLPVELGIAPGNGTLVAAVAAASGRSPQVAGKPYPPLLLRAAEIMQASSPLVVGDRLDTDIEGARNAKLPSVLVLTGVTHTLDLWRAPEFRRPSHLTRDVSGLLAPPLQGEVRDGVGSCEAARARVDDDNRLVVETAGNPLAGVWAAAQLLWHLAVEPGNAVEVARALDAELRL